MGLADLLLRFLAFFDKPFFSQFNIQFFHQKVLELLGNFHIVLLAQRYQGQHHYITPGIGNRRRNSVIYNWDIDIVVRFWDFWRYKIKNLKASRFI